MTAAEVSSHDDSIPRMIVDIKIFKYSIGAKVRKFHYIVKPDPIAGPGLCVRRGFRLFVNVGFCISLEEFFLNISGHEFV